MIWAVITPLLLLPYGHHPPARQRRVRIAGRIYDHFGFYAPAFGSGVVFNLANPALIGFLVMRPPGRGRIVNGTLAVYAINEDAPQPRIGATLENTP